MLISYPFLPKRDTDVSDENYDKGIASMALVAAGHFPSSHDGEWHGGVHIQAGTHTEPVRSIADGTLIAYRWNDELIKERDTDEKGRIDNSFVLIKHETETDSIGDDTNPTPVKVVFYSLYMHLMNHKEYVDSVLGNQALPRVHTKISSSGNDQSGNNITSDGQTKIYRKDVIGYPGESYSNHNVIHFEIFATDDALSNFFVNSKNSNEIGTKGIWGDSYFIIKAGTNYVANHPNLRGQVIGEHRFPSGTAGTTETDIYVQIAFKEGSKYTYTWVSEGESKPPSLISRKDGVCDIDYEYDMYKIATTLYPSCPSAGYELLRFGKIFGPDKNNLAAAENHNWQLIPLDGDNKQGYINLAADGVQILSDADFPYWLGWQKIEGGLFAASGQQDTPSMLDALFVEYDKEENDTKKDTPPTPNDFALLGIEYKHVWDWLERMVCKFPSEWDKRNNTRWDKLKQKDGLGNGKDGPYFGQPEKEFIDHMKFVESLQWWDKSGLDSSSVWHFHPLRFIQHQRKCGWLSLRELSQVVQSDNHRTIATVSALFLTELRDPSRHNRVLRPSGLYPRLPSCMKKYGIGTSLRQASWFGQILQETGLFTHMREGGDDAYFTNYYEGRCHANVQRLIRGQMKTLSPLGNCQPGDGVRFSGKGMIQITGGDNYRLYQAYRGGGNFVVDPGPESIITNAYNACDAGGFYWVSKERFSMNHTTGRLELMGKRSINYWTDQIPTNFSSDQNARHNLETAVESATKCVNPGLDGEANRLSYFKHAFSYLSDMTDNFPPEFKKLRD